MATCYKDWFLNCNKQKCSRQFKEYLCGKECFDKSKPCNKTCHQKVPHNCNGECLTKTGLNDKKKWIHDGKCLELTEPYNGTICAQPDWEVNCKGQCEFEQSFYDCNGKCQSVNELCNGECKSKARPWKCPNGNGTCVSNYLCSGYDISHKFFISEKKACPFVENNYREVCEKEEGLKDVKCKFPKVACAGHRRQCIYPKRICDGTMDCMDRSDESGCRQHESNFDPNDFKDCIVNASNKFHAITGTNNKKTFGHYFKALKIAAKFCSGYQELDFLVYR